MCHRIGLFPIRTIGFGLNSVSSRKRVPFPPHKITVFILVASLSSMLWYLVFAQGWWCVLVLGFVFFKALEFLSQINDYAVFVTTYKVCSALLGPIFPPKRCCVTRRRFALQLTHFYVVVTTAWWNCSLNQILYYAPPRIVFLCTTRSPSRNPFTPSELRCTMAFSSSNKKVPSTDML